MLALRFGDIDFARGLITPRGETKSKTQKQALSLTLITISQGGWEFGTVSATGSFSPPPEPP